MTDPSTPTPAGGGLRKQRRAHAFVAVPSTTIRDRRLSFRARGVLAWLLDQPDGWDVRAAVIAGQGTEGRDAIETALRELRAAGYYRLERRQLPGGTFAMGTAVAEDAQPAWAASHAAHGGRAVPVVVDQLGNVVELEPSAPVTDSQGPADQAPVDPAPAPRSPTQTETQTETMGEELGGDPKRAPSPTPERPLPSCPRTHPAGAACGACRADRLALEAYEAAVDELVAQARQEAAAALAAVERTRAEHAAAELASCHLCNEDGVATWDDPEAPGGVAAALCQHDDARNRRAVEARRAARAAIPTTRSTAQTRARARGRARQTQEA